MIRIVLCEDLDKDAEGIAALLEEYQRDKGLKLEIERFSNADDLLEDMEMGGQPDVLFMDIYLPGRDGMEAVREIRRMGASAPRPQVVFLTISPDHALMAYDLDARQYLVKPVKKERLFDVLDQILDDISPSGGGLGHIVIRERGGGTSRVAVGNILYCETQGNYQVIKTGNEELTTRLSAGKIQEMLCACPGFVNIGSTYIINLQKVLSLRNGDVLMEGEKRLALSRRRFLELKGKYFDFFAKEAAPSRGIRRGEKGS